MCLHSNDGASMRAASPRQQHFSCAAGRQRDPGSADGFAWSGTGLWQLDESVAFRAEVWDAWLIENMQTNDNAMVMAAAEIPTQKVAAGTGATMQMLIGPDRAPHFFLRRFCFEPGGGIPRHTNQVEHEQYVLRGRAKVGIGDAVYEVKPGDVVFIPQAVPHWYRAEGNEPFEFLCAVPNLPDRMEILPP